MVNSIAVFCGASSGNKESYTEAGVKLGTWLSNEEITLIYGGASLGLMGTVASTVMSNGGKVVGVMPEILANREISKPNISELVIVPDMHARKKMMNERAEGFIALPGGAGTMEEMFEIITWSQIGVHQKPFAFYNVDSYYDHLSAFLDQMVAAGFTQARLRNDILITSSLTEIKKHFSDYVAPGPRTY